MRSLRHFLRVEKLLGTALPADALGALDADLPINELARLKDFVSIDSATLNRAGVDQMQSRVGEILERLGFRQEEFRGESRFGHLILAERPGAEKRFITLVTHSDTVLPNTHAFQLKLEQGIAAGSGVIDNKGGLVVGLGGLERFLRQHPRTHYGLRFICSPNEEMGSIGFTDLYRDLGVDTVVAFGLEPALDDGSIIHQRRGNRWYDIEITGREAHAGRSYGHHANAAYDLASKMVDLNDLNDYKRDVSVSVGHIEGGKDRHNIVCGWAKAKIDCRFPSLKAREKLHRKIEKILTKSREKSVDGRFQTQTEFAIVDDCPPFSLNAHSKRMAREYSQLVSRLEKRRVTSKPAGGAGDVNYLSTKSNFVLDGLGPVGGDMHTNREFVRVETLRTRSAALAGFLSLLQGREI